MKTSSFLKLFSSSSIISHHLQQPHHDGSILFSNNKVGHLQTVLAWILCLLAASISSAGGVGGGALYLPILSFVSGLDLKTAATFSAFMVTAGSLSNVTYNLWLMMSSTRPAGEKPLIDFDIALLSQPCLLLGVSIGVVFNVMFPEWLITALFAAFLAASTLKTCRAGFRCWKDESGGVIRNINEEGVEEALLGEERRGGLEIIPWEKMMVLAIIWLSFFVLHVLTSDATGKSIMHLKPCGVGYWLITLLQVPLAVAFTAYILYLKRRLRNRNQEKIAMDTVGASSIEALPVVTFPLVALLTGVLGGLFGIGGGLLINPVLLHIGVPPQTTAATTSFMVLFSSSMSLVEYLILGMKGIKQALVFAIICFIASTSGLVIIQQIIRKSGRASLIVFAVGTVMALSTALVTCNGAIAVWRDYTSGKTEGFKLPC